MSMYDDERSMNRQRDLVLANNEFCFVQSQTNGTIRTYVGPTTVSISQQESLVLFDKRTKQFKQIDHDGAKQLFVTAPEGWYVVLKNPTVDGQFPESGTSNNSPETMKVGVKINIAGPISFALYPGQMAKVVRGHKLRSNQYLLTRVYDADAIESGGIKFATSIDPDGNEIEEKSTSKYGTGQLLIIKGTEVSFYMPPTGIEVVPNSDGTYVRDAVTLERLNYAILKNEDGEKRYVHGPAVVFPEPTESFALNADGSPIFRAMELSPISGIYVKVIAPYQENGVKHELGEELFITGDENGQKIYYPRPEHAIISYGDQVLHHAIAIPTGEGRYILDRMTGEIETVKGPKMFLPDPRKQVVVKRILTPMECKLLYPNNEEVMAYNSRLRENPEAESARAALAPSGTKVQPSHVALAGISRQTTFTKPRTITLDTKFDGVVSVDIWTGYAINVVSKTGERQIVVGPTTRLLDYDETVESLQLSTGKPKTTDRLETVAFLRVANNKVSDIITAQTKDFVDVRIKVSYVVDFLREYQDKWFSVENYVKYLCDHERTAIKKAVKSCTIQELHADLIEIVASAVLDMEFADDASGETDTNGHLFTENGMFVKDVEVLRLEMDRAVEQIISEHQLSMVREALELSDAEERLKLQQKLSEAQRQEEELRAQVQIQALELDSQYRQRTIEVEREQAALAAKAELEAARAKKALQATLDAIHQAELGRRDAQYLQEIKHRNMDAATEKERQQNYAAAIEQILVAIQPDLVAALTAKANAEMLTDATQAMAPWAIARGESIPETVNKMLRGTTLENVFENIQLAGVDD